MKEHEPSSNDPDRNRENIWRGSNNNINFRQYVDAEMDLFDMITDGVIDIYVDSKGIFHYFPSKRICDELGEFVKLANFRTFSDILSARGLNINTYTHFKNRLRKLNP